MRILLYNIYMANPEDVERTAGPRERVNMNMPLLKQNTLGDINLLRRETWKDNGILARAILTNASLGELVEGCFLSKDAPFLRIVQKKEEDDKGYVDRLWEAKLAGRCADKKSGRQVWESLKNTEVRKMDIEQFNNIISMELQGMKKKFDNKYFNLLDERTFAALAVQEMTPGDYDGYVRTQLFDMALQEGDLSKVPSNYDSSVSFGPWQMTKVAYDDLLEQGGGSVGLPAKFQNCVSYEAQARAAVFYGYRRILQIQEAILGSVNLKKIFEAADASEQRKFLTALLAKGHNGGSGRLDGTLSKVKVAALGATSLQQLYGQIFKNSTGCADGYYAKCATGIYSEL